MNWDAIGSIGEIVGAIGVIVTLGYLAAQIRQNTRSVEAAAFDSSANFIIATRQSLFENPEVAHIYYLGSKDPEALDDEERLRFRLIMHNVLWAFGNSFKQGWVVGASTEELAVLAVGLRRIIITPGGKWFWDDFSEEFEPSFRAEVERPLEIEAS